MDIIKISSEPEWLEKKIIGDIRLWQIIFLCLAGITTISILESQTARRILGLCATILDQHHHLPSVVMVCCCFRFRIPRTKQQIEADYQRRKITSKFRQQLETIQDSKMDDMSLKDALDLLHEKTSQMGDNPENQAGSQPSSIMSPQQSSLEASFQPEGGQKPEPQVGSGSFVKFASKVATLSKLAQPKSPTSPTTSGNKMDF